MNNITININSDKESYVLTKNNNIVKCLNIISNKNEVYIVGNEFEATVPFYSKPCDSTSIFGIFMI